MPYLKNLERDMIWPDQFTPLTEGTTNGWTDDPLSVRTGNLLFENVAFMRVARAALTGGPGNKCFGVTMFPPVAADRTPYRVRGCQMNSSYTLNSCWGYGFVSATGVDVDVDDPVIFWTGPRVDEIVAVPYNSGAPDDFICFFALQSIDAMNNFTCSLSVQRLLGKPPQFSSMVS